MADNTAPAAPPPQPTIADSTSPTSVIYKLPPMITVNTNDQHQEYR